MKLDLSVQRRRLERAWAAYNTPGDEPLTGHAALEGTGLANSGLANTASSVSIGRDIMQSWRRSSRGVSPACRTAPVDDPQETLREWRGSLLYAAAAPLLHEIEHTAESNDFIVGVCDGAGKLLWTHSGRHMQRRAESLHFVPGGHWDEQSVGTNALALALRRGTPSTVFSAEHYLEAVHDWVCYSAPIRDPASGLSLGVLDFSTTWQNHNALGLMTATALARYIEVRLAQLAPAPSAPAASSPNSAAVLHLTLCGAATVTLEGTPLRLSPRRLELLALLALYPSGLSLDALHAHLYGDEAVSLSTLKAELSGLRQQLGGRLSSRPYRLDLAVTFDALELGYCLETGDLPGALRLYRGSLLPFSRSPTLSDWRVFLEDALRQAALQRADADLLWSLVSAAPDAFGCDPEVLSRLSRALHPGDPRLPLAQARLRLVGF